MLRPRQDKQMSTLCSLDRGVGVTSIADNVLDLEPLAAKIEET